ncbi:hypothetical protein EMIT040CA3_170013 [Bacillus pseudomycoides]
MYQLKNKYSPSILNEEQKKELQQMIDEGLDELPAT